MHSEQGLKALELLSFCVSSLIFILFYRHIQGKIGRQLGLLLSLNCAHRFF